MSLDDDDAEIEPQGPEPNDLLDLHEIAAIFCVTEKAVRGWIAVGLPVYQRGTQGGARKRTRISLRVAAEWYFRENFERLELDRERTRVAREQADSTALDNAERRKEIGVLTEMAEFYGQHIDRAQRRLQQIPQSLGQYCDDKTRPVVTAAAARLIDECVRELGADGAEVPAAAAVPVEAKAAADGKPVVRQASKAKRRKQR